MKVELHSLNVVYEDRNLLAMAFAKMAQAAGWPVWLGLDEADPDPAWPVLFIETPYGQVSYHIPAREVVGIWDDPDPAVSWDFHSTREKHKRLKKLIEQHG